MKTYNWLHIPTGIQGTRTTATMSQLQMLEKINHWNAMGGGDWLYWL